MSASSEGLAVVGLGNPLRRDDGVGILVLDMLRQSLRGRDIAFYDFGTASLGLVNLMKDFRRVLLIDAVDAGLPPATLRLFPLSEAASPPHGKKVSSHELSLADLAGLCRSLGVDADVRVAGIQAKDTSFGLELSHELDAARERVAGEIKDFLEGWRREPGFRRSRRPGRPSPGRRRPRR
jgi:hydrogenase maturation protease